MWKNFVYINKFLFLILIVWAIWIILFDEEYSKVYKPITIKFLYKKKMFDNIDDNLLKINSGKSELYICPKKNKEDGFIKIS